MSVRVEGGGVDSQVNKFEQVSCDHQLSIAGDKISWVGIPMGCRLYQSTVRYIREGTLPCDLSHGAFHVTYLPHLLHL